MNSKKLIKTSIIVAKPGEFNLVFYHIEFDSLIYYLRFILLVKENRRKINLLHIGKSFIS